MELRYRNILMTERPHYCTKRRCLKSCQLEIDQLSEADGHPAGILPLASAADRNRITALGTYSANLQRGLVTS
jgi:hypothetical protein